MAIPLSLTDLDLSDLKGKSVLITGGASGLGHQTAKLLAKSGAYITIADIQPSEPVIQSFKDLSLAIQYVQCDVRDWAQQVVAFKQAINFSPSRCLDIVCCFAGIDKQGHLLEHITKAEPAIIDEPLPPNTDELDINLKGTLYSTDLALHYFRLPGRPGKKAKRSPPVRSPSSSDSDNETKDNGTAAQVKPQDPAGSETPTPTKSLIIVSSMSGYMYDPYHSIYTTSKFGTRGLFIAINKEARNQLNVRCNLIAPWGIQTPMTMPLLEDFEKAGFLERIDPVGKAKMPETESVSKTTDDKEDGGTEVCTTEEEPMTVTTTTTDVPDTPKQEPTTGTKDDDHQTTTELAQETSSEVTDTEKAPSSEPVQDEPQPHTNGPQPTEPTEAATTDTTTTGIPSGTSSLGEATSGVQYKGISFASGEDLANTIAKCCTDDTISGRAFAIMPEGVFDLGDDLEGGYGGDVLRQLMKTRKEAGDIFSG